MRSRPGYQQAWPPVMKMCKAEVCLLDCCGLVKLQLCTRPYGRHCSWPVQHSALRLSQQQKARLLALGARNVRATSDSMR